MFYKGLIKKLEEIELEIVQIKANQHIYKETTKVLKRWEKSLKEGNNPIMMLIDDGDKFIAIFEKYMEKKKE